MTNTIAARFTATDSGFAVVAKQVADTSEESSQRMRSTVDTVAGRVGGLEGPFMGMADLLDGLGGVVGVDTSAASGYMRSIGDLAGGFSTILPVFGALSTVWGAIGAFAAANPIGLAVIGVVALGAGLYLAYQRFDGFRAFVQGGFSLVSTAFQGVIGAASRVVDWVRSVFSFGGGGVDVGAVLGGLSAGFGGFRQVIGSIFEWASSFPASIWNAFAGWWNRNFAGRQFGVANVTSGAARIGQLASSGIDAVFGSGTASRFGDRVNAGISSVALLDDTRSLAAAAYSFAERHGTWTVPPIPVLHGGGTMTDTGVIPLRRRRIEVNGPALVTRAAAERTLADIVRLAAEHPGSDLILNYG